MTQWKYDLGFIGAGNMAEAIAKAALDKRVLAASRMIAADVSQERREVFAALGIAVCAEPAQVVRQAGQVLLAVKPQTLPQLAPALGEVNADEQVVLSIMAGVSAAKIGSLAGRPLRIVRIMPNTPLMVGQGMAAIALGADAREGDDALAVQLFEAGGKALRVAEAQIDAITAVSGSGPAYVFYLAQAMEEAAAELGLGEHARTLVRQTILGAAQLMVQSGDPPAELRRKVTSPGGTTEAAIRHMDGNSTRQVIIDAIKAAEKRARELGA
ncbi:MAG: pyrroline-5-carboxylate reductase [Phycisphaeraceae bacterium]